MKDESIWITNYNFIRHCRVAYSAKIIRERGEDERKSEKDDDKKIK